MGVLIQPPAVNMTLLRMVNVSMPVAVPNGPPGMDLPTTAKT
jgi:hypothetical protein